LTSSARLAASVIRRYVRTVSPASYFAVIDETGFAPRTPIRQIGRTTRIDGASARRSLYPVRDCAAIEVSIQQHRRVKSGLREKSARTSAVKAFYASLSFLCITFTTYRILSAKRIRNSKSPWVGKPMSLIDCTENEIASLMKINKTRGKNALPAFEICFFKIQEYPIEGEIGSALVWNVRENVSRTIDCLRDQFERGSGRRLTRLPFRIIFNELPESFCKRTLGKTQVWIRERGGKEEGDSRKQRCVSRTRRERRRSEELPAKNINNAF